MSRHLHQNPSYRRPAELLIVIMTALTLVGCSSSRLVSTQPLSASRAVTADQSLIGSNDHFTVLLAAEGDSWKSLAQQFYGDSDLYWHIEDANPGATVKAGQEIVIPLQESSRLGVEANSVSAVSILAYHGFGNHRGRLTITRSQFENQMRYLLEKDYRIITLSHFIDFLSGKRAIPKRAVMIAIDDGHSSAYSIAFPVLKKFGFAATLFPYSDYVGQGGLTWEQMREMQASGLIDIQLHSQTHADLTKRKPDETLAQLRKRLAREITAPMVLFKEKLQSQPSTVAYPYGAANQYVVEEVQKARLVAGFTVSRGGNAFYSYPYALLRNQIYRDDTIGTFSRKLTTSIRLDPL